MIYFDNAATTKPFESVKEGIINSIDEFANPNSKYNIGVKNQNKIFETKKILSKMLHCEIENVIFTAGGTEANNLAIFGYVKNKQNKINIASTEFEHKSVTVPLEQLKSSGYNVFSLPHTNGVFDLNKIIPFIEMNNINFIVLSHVYNEIGIMQNLESLTIPLKKQFPSLHIHVDCVQSFMKYNINFNKLNIDSLSISGHKVHSIKGIGALIIKSKNQFKPVIFGSTQNNGLRAGTDNLTGIVALNCALKEWEQNLTNYQTKITNLKTYFDKKFDELFIDNETLFYLTPRENGAKHIVALGVKNILSEHLIHYFEEKEIYVSAGSACNGKGATPLFLKPLNIPAFLHQGIIRISFSVFNKESEIDEFFKHFIDAINYFKR